jgi:alanine racemase
MRATRALVYLDRFKENLRAVAGWVGKRRLCVPLKADAYGHGALPLARAALEAGAHSLAVAFVQEGEELRRGGIGAPILLLAPWAPEELEALVTNGLEPLVSGGAAVDALDRAARARGLRLNLHLKVDTGMGRAGCRPEEAAALAERIRDRGNLRLAGVATHLAAADSPDPGDIAFTKTQLRRFREALGAIRAAGIDPGIVHAANSGGVLYHPDSWFDMVRPGILLYGYPPRPSPLPVRPLMELRSRVAAVKSIRAGEPVSYGRTWTAAEPVRIALIPLGYADGLRRDLGGIWRVGIRGRTYPIVGRICMDQCLVNLGKDGEGPAVEPGDEVLVLAAAPPEAGEGPAPAGDAAAMAEILGTIPYEICCGLSRRVPRVYIGREDP